MHWFRSFICKLFGHNDVVIVMHSRRYDYPRSGGSTWGYFHCSRCERDVTFNYDE